MVEARLVQHAVELLGVLEQLILLSAGQIDAGLLPLEVLHQPAGIGVTFRDLLPFLLGILAQESAEKLRENTRGLAVDFLACGLDPEKAVFFAQSAVPEVNELAWILSTLCPMGLLERCHSYKDKVAKGFAASHALFAYPALMAADILLYDSDAVPVGKDQKQHLEVTRDLAGKVNDAFGEGLLKMPEAIISEATAVVPGLDGQKMSKSYGNTLPIFGEEKPLRKLINKKVVTDATPLEDPKPTENSIILALYKLFATPEQYQAMVDAHHAGGVGYGQFKKDLSPTIQFMTLIKGGKGSDQGIDGMLEIVSLPVASAQFPSGREIAYIPAFLDIIQEYTLDSMEKDTDAYGGLVNYTANIVRSEDMKIAFSRDDIAVSLDSLEDDTTFGKDMLLMDEEEVDALLINNAEKTLVSYVVAPFEPQPGMYCYKMLIDTQNHKLYYYKRHKITSKAGAGFLKDDLKRIYYVR